MDVALIWRISAATDVCFSDMYISTLRDYIRAMGGDLELIATFPDGQVKIDNFAR
ncbi:Cro-like protein [Pseudomonas sp. R4-39-08]|nr:Cro-like protein [Pseudomonas sp. R4-39-08]